MNDELMQDLEGYLKLVGAFARRWSSPQRTAYVVCLAERWFTAYSDFARVENCGNPATLQAAIEAVWSHLAGKSLSASEIATLSSQVVELAPSMDEFDAFSAMTACQLVGLAVESCAAGAGPGCVTEAVAAAYTAVAEPVAGYPGNPSAEREMFAQPGSRAEIAQQFRLMQQIAASPIMNPMILEALRRTNAPRRTQR